MPKSPAAVFMTVKDRSYAVRLDTLSSNRYFQQPFGRQLDDQRKIKEFKETAKHTHIGAKRRATMAAVKEWVKMMKPLQFFASWAADSDWNKDDCVEIWYTLSDTNKEDEVERAATGLA